MERRQFFTLGLKRAMQAVTHLVATRMTRSKCWIRPPFALQERDFLLRCNHCDRCVQACPHGVIFKLSFQDGPHVMGTPALDLLHQGCQLCEDWPCVAACEPQALQRPTEAGNSLPRLSQVRIHADACLPFFGPECKACDTSCPVPGALQWKNGRLPSINPQLCVGCALCRQACIVRPQAILIECLPIESLGEQNDITKQGYNS